MKQAAKFMAMHDTVEWYTPPWCIELAREVLGTVDLDPASAALPQTWIQAKTWFSKEDDGLSREWFGNVWMNPPCSMTRGVSNQAIWTAYLEEQYRLKRVARAIILVYSSLGYKWYEDLWVRYPVCCVRERIASIREDGTYGNPAPKAHSFIYFGDDREGRNQFYEVFKSVGRVLYPHER